MNKELPGSPNYGEVIDFQEHIGIWKEEKMSINISSIRCSTQVALLGAVTSNLRAINVQCSHHAIKLHFYYECTPSEEEEELSEVFVSELWATFSNYSNISVEVKRFVLDKTKPIPNPGPGIRIFHRFEGYQ